LLSKKKEKTKKEKELLSKEKEKTKKRAPDLHADADPDEREAIIEFLVNRVRS
jgi:hypothetical protein